MNVNLPYHVTTLPTTHSSELQQSQPDLKEKL